VVNSKTQLCPQADFALGALAFCNCFLRLAVHAQYHMCDSTISQYFVCWVSRHVIWPAYGCGLSLWVDCGLGSLPSTILNQSQTNFSVVCSAIAE